MAVTLKELLTEAAGVASRRENEFARREGGYAKVDARLLCTAPSRRERKAIERAIETEFEAIERDCPSTARLFPRPTPC